MIEPDFNLLLWLLLIATGLKGITQVILGAIKIKLPETYDVGNVILGLILIFIVFLVCIL